MSDITFVIFDLDGTFTLLDEECVPYTAAYKQDLQEKLGLPNKDFERLWSQSVSAVSKHPHLYGWKEDGKLILPGDVDPLILSCVTTGLIFDRMGLYLADNEIRKRVLDGFYKKHRGKRLNLFKPEAVNVLDALANRSCIVTNTSEGDAREKLSALELQNDVPVHGSAYKFGLDDGLTSIPRTMHVEGLGRPIYPRRGSYHRILTEIMAERDLRPNQVLVVGDIYELDLVLPQQMGMHIALVERDNMHSYERSAVNSYPKGGVISNLDEAIELAA